jgi:YebC/PmpR family DNA-binding regulatory protein
MAGHSHWARIKRAKASNDARRGKVWSKLSRAIIVAARNGGSDPDTNLALRYAIDAAKADNMPKDTIERAIKKGAGGLDGARFEELLYEGYGPGGAAIICSVLSDNRNRTAPEIKRIFEQRGGNLGATNCVGWMFESRGVIIVSADAADEESLTDLALEAGADDLRQDDGAFELTCDPSAFDGLRKALADADIKFESAEVSMIPSSNVTLAGDEARKMIGLIEGLEDHDDVQKVYSNCEISDADMEKYAG